MIIRKNSNKFLMILILLLWLPTNAKWNEIQSNLKSVSIEPIDFSGMYFINNSVGWITGTNSATGDMVVFRTEDGGDNWTEILNQLSGTDELILKNILNASFIDNNTGFIYLANSLYSTNNGGKNWNKIEPGLEGVKKYLFFSKNRWVASSSDYHILFTHDEGVTWDTASINDIEDLEGPPIGHSIHNHFFLDSSTGFIAIDLGYVTADYVFKTNDGGKNWEPLISGGITVYAIDSLHIYSTCRSELFSSSIGIRFTFDGGKTINQANKVTIGDSSINIVSPSVCGFTSSLVGIGSAVVNVERKYISTSDGGLTWRYDSELNNMQVIHISKIDTQFIVLTQSGKLFKGDGKVKVSKRRISPVHPFSPDINKAILITGKFNSISHDRSYTLSGRTLKATQHGRTSNIILSEPIK